MTASPSKENSAAYHAALAVAIATVEGAKALAEDAVDDVQIARDETLRSFGTSVATTNFNNPIADIRLAIGALANALADLPALPENDDQTEEGASASDRA
jgi:hypothetical protein